MMETSKVDKVDGKTPISRCGGGKNMTELNKSVASGSKSNQGYLGVIHMANDDEPLPIHGGGGTCHYEVTNANDTSFLCKLDNLLVSKLLATASLDVLPPGEVYVPFPPGSGKNTGTHYSCTGQMLKHDQVYPAPVFDSKAQKQVLRTIWKPRTGTFQYVLDTMPQETLEQSKGQQRMQYCLEEIVDVNGQHLYFELKAELMCHISHHQATQQTLLTASQIDQPDICSPVTVSPLGGRFDQQAGPQMGSGQGNGILVPGFGFFPCHLVSAVAKLVHHAASVFSSTTHQYNALSPPMRDGASGSGNEGSR